MKNRGAACPCGAGRGFRAYALAKNVREHTTLQPTNYHKCWNSLWHWTPKDTP